LATSWDIARAAGVSQATVSRVLNDDPRVAEPTRLRVLEVITRLGYTPNAVARGLVTSQTNLVGVVVADIMNPFYPELLEAISAQLVQHGLRMVFSNAARQPEEVYARLLMEQRVDGIIFTAAHVKSNTVRTLASQRFPVVLVNRSVDGAKCDLVVGDNATGSKAAADHLLELGHKRIGVLLGYPESSTSRDRMAAFSKAIEDGGLEVDQSLVRVGQYDYEEAYRQTRQLLDIARRPTALFCLNDAMALAALNAARAAGVAVPDDLSIVGFDDIRMAAWEAFQLTTVRQPLTEMARASVDLLAERIASPDKAVRKMVFPSLLIRRQTTARPRRRNSGRSVAQPRRF
jgi:LacI family transcriptional regulator